jgi:viroplasmin and RNaseH domain-containing protein
VQVWAPNTRSAKRSKEARGRHRSGRAAFYIVVKGRKCGVFYKWEDCLASVANFDQAVFFGVDSLEEAQLL